MDVILQLIEKAGDFVSDDIWYRVVQFVTNNDDLQVLITCILHTYLNVQFVQLTNTYINVCAFKYILRVIQRILVPPVK